MNKEDVIVRWLDNRPPLVRQVPHGQYWFESMWDRVLTGLMCAATGAALVSVPWLGFATALMQASPVKYVGHGCEGATAAIYAAEESDFPVCDEIEPLPPVFSGAKVIPDLQRR